jgi:hypothetical protein
LPAEESWSIPLLFSLWLGGGGFPSTTDNADKGVTVIKMDERRIRVERFSCLA